ncbi:ABC transporter permease [Calditerricola satsumensis]
MSGGDGPVKGLWGLVWRNVRRRASRARLLGSCAALTAGLLFASYFFLHSLTAGASVTAARLGADLLVVPKGLGPLAGDALIAGMPTDSYLPDRVVSRLARLPGVERVAPQLYLKTVSTVCCGTDGDFPVVAFDPQADFTLKPWMAALRDLGPEEVVIGAKAGGDRFLYHYDYGTVQERVLLFGRPFVVRNVLYPTGTGTDQTIFMRLDTARRLAAEGSSDLRVPADAVSVVHVQVAPGQAEAVKRAIEREVGGVDVVLGAALRETVRAHLVPVKALSFAIIAAALAMSVLLTMVAVSGLLSERRKEVAMLRAMGATRGMAIRLFLLETAFVTAVGAAAGALFVGSVLYDARAFLRELFGLPLLVPSWRSGLAMGAVAVAATAGAALGAALWPVRQALKAEPHTVLGDGTG